MVSYLIISQADPRDLPFHFFKETEKFLLEIYLRVFTLGFLSDH